MDTSGDTAIESRQDTGAVEPDAQVNNQGLRESEPRELLGSAPSCTLNK